MEVFTALGSIGSAFGLSSSAGLNAYIPLLIVALGSRYPIDDPLIRLAQPYDLLASWWVIVLLFLLLLIELTVDKIPAIDTINDLIQTFIRPAAGAILFAASANVITDLNPVVALSAGLILAGGVHATKAVVRPVVTATTAGTGNWFLSIVEDVTAIVLSLVAILLPALAFLILSFALLLLSFIVIYRRRRKRVAVAFE
jgi:nicotinamide riboside transporter PnuC